VKTFEKFLAESSKQYKSLGDNTGKIDTKKTPGNILSDIEQKQFVKNEKSKKQYVRNLEPQNKVKKNVIPGSKQPPVTRYDSREPFMDDDLGQRTGKTGDKVSNKQPSQTGKVVLDAKGNPLAYKGKNIPVSEPKAGETMIKGIKDADLEQKALDQTRKDLLKSKNTVKTDQNPPTKTNTVKPDQKSVDTPNTTTKKDKVTSSKIDLKKGQKQLTDLDLDKIQTNKTPRVKRKVTRSKIDLKPGQKQLTDLDLDKIQTNKTPRVKRFVTKPKSITDFQGFAKRGAQRTGLAPTKPKIEVGGKLKTLSTDKVTKDILKQTPKRLKLSRALGTLGRVAGGAYAVKDFMDVARKEKALGRSKTSARLGGLSRALGGYIGGGIGATLGSGVAGLPGGIVGGGAGYHYGTKVGDKLYNIGRQYATGEKKLNVGKTFKNLRNDINANAKKLNLKNLGRNIRDQK